MKLVALDAGTLRLPEEAWASFRQFGDLKLHDYTPYEKDVIVERALGAEVVFTNKVPFRREVLAALPNLKLIAVLATGYNIIDLAVAADRKVTVCNVPGYATLSTAQHTLALLLELTNQVALHAASVRAGEWVRSRHFCYWKADIRELAGKTVGLVGFGSIGRKVGEILSALGMKVLAYQRNPRNPPNWPGFGFADLPELFRRADVISLHCPATPENQHFVNAALLETVKPTALLINTARGSLIDEKALAAALNEGQLAGAALDVLETEPMREDHPLRLAPNCLITPHNAWASQEARQRLLSITFQNVRHFLEGEPQNVVKV